jgi:hypothetical protein
MKKRVLKSLALLLLIFCCCLSAFVEIVGGFIFICVIVVTAVVETALLPLHYAFWLVTGQIYTYRVFLFILDANTHQHVKKLTNQIQEFGIKHFDSI